MIFRMYVGAPAASPEDHVIGGSGAGSGESDNDALLGQFSTDGCTWLKQIELGGASPGIEEVAGVVRLSGGGHAVAMHASGVPASGFLMLIDDSGTLLNCTRIEDPAGVYIGDITQLYDGTLLLSGSTAGGIGTMYKFTGTGSLVWSRQCAGCTYNTISSFYQDPFGDLYGLGNGTIFEVSPDGDACGFTDVASTTVSSFTPAITDLAVVNDLAPPVTVSSMSMFGRTPAGSSSVVCSTIGIGETAGEDPLVAFPVPTDDVVRLGSAGHVTDGEPFEVRDPAGRLVRHMAYADGLDLRGLGSGIYMVTSPRTQMRAIVQKR